MMNKKTITEEMGIHKEFYKEAKGMTLDKLPEFLNKLMDDYEHDYGTICHALAAGAIATMWAMNKHPQGGITGFQAGCIMWEFIRNWMNEEGPLKLLSYEKMLYPQYIDRFDKIISKDTWEWLQEQAKQKLDGDIKEVHPTVVAHWSSIKDGEVPFGYRVAEE